MSESSQGGGPPRDRGDETGEPILLLDGLVEEPSSRFLVRLRRRIGRRAVTTQVLVLAWEVPRLVVLQLIEVVFGLVGPRSKDKGGPS